MSQDRAGDELGITRQRDDARKLAQVRGLTVVGEHVDNDVSAAGKVKRPGFDALIKDLEAGRVSVVIAWDLTRLTRNARDTLRLLEAGEKAGAMISCVKGSDLNLATADGQMTAGVLAAIAQGEIKKKSERQRAANIQAATDGRRVGGRRPFGYEQNGVTVRRDEADALRHIYGDVARGLTLAGAARILNERGLLSPQLRRRPRTPDGQVAEGPQQASPWIAQSLRTTLLNPRYAGMRATKLPGKRDKWTIHGKAAWDGLVPEETWRAVNEILRDPDRATAQGHQALLTGIARCGAPGCGMTVRAGRNLLGQPIYRCPAASAGHVTRRRDPVDDWIGSLVVARLSREDARELLVDDRRPDVAALREQARALDLKLKRLAVQFADDLITAHQLEAATARARKRRDEIEAQIADAGKQSLLGPLINARNPKAVYEALHDDQKRAVIDALMTVELLPVGRGTRTFRTETVIATPRGRL
ncbi:DNA invertase Pin-like site-specific DNA recombinase [Hamadaea flava]|nr:DNA invertase Pin-like site-specific DNA recombinase [Hamadaea flava]